MWIVLVHGDGGYACGRWRVVNCATTPRELDKQRPAYVVLLLSTVAQLALMIMRWRTQVGGLR